MDEQRAATGIGTIEASSRVLSPVEPTVGGAVLFSSGWENMHFVEPTTDGCRFSLPAAVRWVRYGAARQPFGFSRSYASFAPHNTRR